MTLAPTSSRLKTLALVALLGLLLVLALRLTMSESLRLPLAQKAALAADHTSSNVGDLFPFIGPAMTTSLALATAALAALAASCAAVAGALTSRRLDRVLLIALILVLAGHTSFHAANHFNALIGTVDLYIALAAGWSISLLCHSRLLGDRGRRIIIAALIAILAAWVAKGLYQRFVEFPDTIAEYLQNRSHYLEQQGINPADTYRVTLFESRLHASQVSGFLPLSNVFAAGLIGLLTLLAGLLAASLVSLTSPPPELSAQSKNKNHTSTITSEIPLPILLLSLGFILLLFGLAVVFLTGSRGGSILSICCLLTVAIGALFWRKLVALRTRLLICIAALALIAPAAVITYGLRYDSLPSQSLTFRWHYWTATTRLIEQSPIIGIGLNNFGDYYGSVKRPSSPEDVNDPHSFFLRFAAELGLYTALLVAILIIWRVFTASRLVTHADNSRGPPLASPLKTFLVALALCLFWWLLHYFLADAPFAFNLYVALLLALLSAAAALLSVSLTTLLTPAGLRAVALAALIGALGMLAYDQINMALVTGPVAMLFWMLLGLADSYEPPTSGSPSLLVRIFTIIPPVACAAAALAFAIFVWLPILHHTNPWDPAPCEDRYLQAIQPPANHAAALDALSAALDRAPRSIELLRQRIEAKRALHQPIADDIRRILELDRANARIRIALASLDSDLPPAERLQILEDALHLDAQLPPNELKRLSAEEKAHVQTLIQNLTPPSHPSR